MLEGVAADAALQRVLFKQQPQQQTEEASYLEASDTGGLLAPLYCPSSCIEMDALVRSAQVSCSSTAAAAAAAATRLLLQQQQHSATLLQQHQGRSNFAALFLAPQCLYSPSLPLLSCSQLLLLNPWRMHTPQVLQCARRNSCSTRSSSTTSNSSSSKPSAATVARLRCWYVRGITSRP